MADTSLVAWPDMWVRCDGTVAVFQELSPYFAPHQMSPTIAFQAIPLKTGRFDLFMALDRCAFPIQFACQSLSAPESNAGNPKL